MTQGADFDGHCQDKQDGPAQGEDLVAVPKEAPREREGCHCGRQCVPPEAALGSAPHPPPPLRMVRARGDGVTG